MMTGCRALIFSLVILMLSVKTASSHHSSSPVFDGSTTITIVGVVTQFEFVNPHSSLVIDVTDDAGKIVPWTVELAARLNLSQWGWTADSIKAHERVTVIGNPARTGAPRMLFAKLVHADGTELLPAGPQRTNLIEEERRQRALQRGQQK